MVRLRFDSGLIMVQSWPNYGGSFVVLNCESIMVELPFDYSIERKRRLAYTIAHQLKKNFRFL